MTKTLKDFLEVYKPKSPDEQKFVDKHVVIKHKDRNGNGDDVFNGNTKYIKRKEERKGYDVGEDEKVYEELKGDQHKLDHNKNGKLDAHDFKLMRKKKKVAEEVDEVDEARVWHGDYNTTSEKSQFGGHRPKVTHKEKGHTMFLGQHAYKKPETARKHAEAYLTAYSNIGPKAAENASMDFARANKKHMYEEVDIDTVLDEALDLLMSIDEKTLTPAEMKKREEVVKAIKRDDPKMDKSMAYAIATKTAKRVAEDVEEIDELSVGALKKYRTAARADAYDADDVDDERRFRKRAAGSNTAGKKIVRQGGKLKEDAEDLDESAKIADHLIKRYGDNVRKSHVRSAAGDFGVDASKLAKAVRTKLGKTSLAEDEQIDELSKETKASYMKKAGAEIDKHWDNSKKDARSAYKYYGRKNTMKKIANEEVEELDEISAKKLTDYAAKASDARGHRDMPTEKLDKRYKSMALAQEKIRARHAKVAAEGYIPTADEPTDADKKTAQKVRDMMAKEKKPVKEETQIDELSKKTMGSYIKKASGAERPKNVMSPKNIPLTKIAAYQGDSETGHFGKRFNQATYDKAERLRKNREQGITRATDKLTKEDIINRAVEKYVPEELKFTPEERLLKRLNGLSEAHVLTLMGLFEDLNKDNQNKMIETVETSEGINQILNFVLENRGN